MYEPARDDEITGLVRYLDEQLDAIRAAAIGLTEEQVRSRPCRSALSIGGLIKHVTQGMRRATARLTGGGRTRCDRRSRLRRLPGGLRAGRRRDGGGRPRRVRRGPGRLRGGGGRDGSRRADHEPPAPWYGIYDPRPSLGRYHLVHQIEEMARHAGHADIIREQIDGMAVPAIVLSEAGAPANDFFQPYVPAPGTIGAR